MSMSPKDLDFIEAKHGAAREIALALGVPPMLLGIPGDNTFSNYQEANRNFWRQTVLPLVQRTTASLAEWLAPAYGQSLTLKADLDDIDALSSERSDQWTRLDAATFLTTNEKRAAIGYGPLLQGNTILPVVPRPPAKDFDPEQPRDDQGRWTTGDGADDGGVGDASPDDAPKTPKIGDDGGKPQDAAGKPKTMADILLPGGKEVGVQDKGAGPGIRTVTPSDFATIKQQLLEGATALPLQSSYTGTWYSRSDGTVFGLRKSSNGDEAIDVRTSNNAILFPGYKVHYK